MFRSKAPLRIGLAGGGTDVSPYADIHGGAILNATISLYAYASIELIQEDKIIIEAIDRCEKQEFSTSIRSLPIDGMLDLAKGVYNSIIQKYAPDIDRVSGSVRLLKLRQDRDSELHLRLSSPFLELLQNG